MTRTVRTLRRTLWMLPVVAVGCYAKGPSVVLIRAKANTRAEPMLKSNT